MSEEKKKQPTTRDYRKLFVEYINGEMTIQALAKAHGVSAGTLSNHASRNGWTKKRDQHRKDLALKANEAAEAETVERHREAVEQAYALRLLAFERLKERMESAEASGFRVSVKDMVDLTRLERDLDMPGWMKSEEEKQPLGTFTVAGFLGEFLDANRKKRQDALEKGAMGDTLAGPDDDQADFMTEGNDDDEESEAGA